MTGNAKIMAIKNCIQMGVDITIRKLSENEMSIVLSREGKEMKQYLDRSAAGKCVFGSSIDLLAEDIEKGNIALDK